MWGQGAMSLRLAAMQLYPFLVTAASLPEICILRYMHDGRHLSRLSCIAMHA